MKPIIVLIALLGMIASGLCQDFAGDLGRVWWDGDNATRLASINKLLTKYAGSKDKLALGTLRFWQARLSEDIDPPDLKTAERSYLLAIPLLGSDSLAPAACNNLAGVYSKKGDGVRAAHFFIKAGQYAGIDPSSSVLYWLFASVDLLKAGDPSGKIWFERAWKRFESLKSDLDAQSVDRIFIWTGQYLHNGRKLRPAEESLKLYDEFMQTAIERNSKSGKDYLLFGKAVFLYDLKRKDESKQILIDLLSQPPSIDMRNLSVYPPPESFSEWWGEYLDLLADSEAWEEMSKVTLNSPFPLPENGMMIAANKLYTEKKYFYAAPIYIKLAQDGHEKALDCLEAACIGAYSGSSSTLVTQILTEVRKLGGLEKLTPASRIYLASEATLPEGVELLATLSDQDIETADLIGFGYLVQAPAMANADVGARLRTISLRMALSEARSLPDAVSYVTIAMALGANKKEILPVLERARKDLSAPTSTLLGEPLLLAGILFDTVDDEAGMELVAAHTVPADRTSPYGLVFFAALAQSRENYAEAVTGFAAILALFPDPGKERDQFLIRLARAQAYNGDAAAAEISIGQIVGTSLNEEQQIKVVDIQSLLCDMREEFGQSADLRLRVAKYSERIGQFDDAAFAYVHAAQALSNIGVMEEANRLVQIALRLCPAEASFTAMDIRHHAASISYAGENYSEALRYAEEAVAAIEAEPQNKKMQDKRAELTYHLAQCHYQLKQPEALAKDIAYLETLNASGYGFVLHLLHAYQNYLAKDWDAANKNLLLHIAAAEANDRSMFVGYARSDLAYIAEKQGNLDLAIMHLKMAVQEFEVLRGKLDSNEHCGGFASRYGPMYRDLADMLLTKGRVGEALDVLRRLKLAEMREFSRSERTSIDLGPVLLLASEAASEKEFENRATQCAKISREREALLEKLKTQPGDAAIQKQLADLADQLKTELAKTTAWFKTVKFSSQAEDSTRLKSVTDSMKQMEGLMPELSRLTGQKAAALFLVVVDDRLHTILVSPRGQITARSALISRRDLSVSISSLRESLQNPAYDPTEDAQQVYKMVFAAIDRTLKAQGVETVMLCTDGSLRYIPFAALHDGKTYLAERYRFVSFNPAAAAHLKDDPVKAQMLAFGASQASVLGAALPYVPNEIESILKLAPGKQILDEQFTLNRFFTEVEQSPRTVVHLATHYSPVSADPQKSFFVLGDGGKLTVADLESRGFVSLFQGVRHLVLSACDTIPNDVRCGREFEGLPSQAQDKGVPTVTASLWAVNDTGTAVFMAEYYRGLTTPGLTAAEALRRAQIALITNKFSDTTPSLTPRSGASRPVEDKHKHKPFTADPARPFAHPYYWAPFQLIGNWR